MLKQSLTYQLVSISDGAIKPATKMYKRRFGLDVHGLRVLRLIGDQPGVNFTALAAQTRFERSATSRLLSHLIKHGLVRRDLDDSDARQFRLFITEKGMLLRQRADPLSLELEDLLLSILGAEERLQFRRTLDKLSGWLAGDFHAELARRNPDIDEAPAGRRKKAGRS